MQNEQSVITGFLDALASILGPLSPFTKAVVPAALGVAVAVVQSLFAGKVDAVGLSIAGSALVLALVVFLVPNKPKVTVVPVKPTVK